MRHQEAEPDTPGVSPGSVLHCLGLATDATVGRGPADRSSLQDSL